MSFAALRDKRVARRDPSASIHKSEEASIQVRQRPPSSPSTAYSDFPDDLLEIRTFAASGRSVYANPSANLGALRKGMFLDLSGFIADTAQGALYSARIRRQLFSPGQHSTNTVRLVSWESTN